jgi:neutral ceramidase
MRWTCVAVALLLSHNALVAQEPKRDSFRAGAYAQDVTPKKYPISVNGGMTDRQAKGAHDPLHARCLVLDDGRTRIAIVVVDSCMIPRDVCDHAKRLTQKATGIAPERILISATHTHSAPTLSGVFQSEPDEDYRQYLAEKIAQGVARAVKNLAPAKIGWGVGQDPTQVFNRRWLMQSLQEDPFGKRTDQVKMNPGYQNKDLIKPAGPIDPDVSIVSVQSREGRPLALLANYTLH